MLDLLFDYAAKCGWTVTNSLTTATAAIGWLFYIWERNTKRSEAKATDLTEVLEPLLSAAQHLRLANNTRRKIETLRHSFPDTAQAQEAAHRIETLLGEYHEFLKRSADELRRLERCYGSRAFRFPTRLSELLKKGVDLLSKTGGYVNEGKFDQADLEIGRVLDNYKNINSYVSGVRWKSRFSWFRTRQEKKFEKKQEADRKRFELSDEEMQEVLDLIDKRITSQAPNAFVVHPPKKLIENPALAMADNVIDELENSVFSIVFQDGTSAMIGLPQLMVLTFQLIALRHQMTQIGKSIAAVDEKPTSVTLSLKFVVNDIMTPELVKVLLSKIEFSKSPSDATE